MIEISSLFFPIGKEASIKLIFQHFINIKTGPFGLTFQELFELKVETFLGHPVEKQCDASKFQIFEIQVFVLNYWWFANDVIKNMTTQIMINLPLILV